MAVIPGPAPTPGSTTSMASLSAQYGAMPVAGAGAGAPMPTEPLLYLGVQTTRTSAYGDPLIQYVKGAPISTTKTDNIVGISRAMKTYDKMSFAEQRDMLRLLAIGGFVGAIPLEDIDEAIQEASQMDARDAYMSLLEVASDHYMNSGSAVTPTDVLRSAIAYRLGGYGIKWDGDLDTFDDGLKRFLKDADVELDEDGQDPLEPYRTVNTTKSVDLMTPQDAKGLTRSMLQAELGRDPTQAEYEDFLATLHAAERENPSTTRTVTQYTPNAKGVSYNTSTTSTTQQGIGAEGLMQVAYEKAQQNPDWAEWQAMGTYFPALLAALGATVPGT